MPTGFNEELKRDIYRDLAAKQNLSMRLARSGRVSACDAMEAETAEDYCRRMLKALGQKSDGRNPIEGLTMFLFGCETIPTTTNTGARVTAMDSDGTDFVSRYIRGEA